VLTIPPGLHAGLPEVFVLVRTAEFGTELYPGGILQFPQESPIGYTPIIDVAALAFDGETVLRLASPLAEPIAVTFPVRVPISEDLRLGFLETELDEALAMIVPWLPTLALGSIPIGVDLDANAANFEINTLGTFVGVMPCQAVDGNCDGVVNAIDIQIVINLALGLDLPYSSDVNGDGKVNAVDIQAVINVALGIFS
jgi:hypothetical protein